MFSEKDIEQINKRGSSLNSIEQQINYFKTGFPFVELLRPATINDGIKQITINHLPEYIEHWHEYLSKKPRIIKFVPASGAATRMFKSLFSFLENGKTDASIEEFFTKLPQFAFYNSLAECMNASGLSIETAQRSDIVAYLLTEKGLNYGSLPKGLLEFHAYENDTRTAIEEHLVEAAQYASTDGLARLHFTVSPEHRQLFEALVQKAVPAYQNSFHIQYEISFSEQQPATDTIAVTPENEPFREKDGSLCFRPAGHGALLANLNHWAAELIYMKNIDNVVPDHLRQSTTLWKKIIGAVLFKKRNKIKTNYDRFCNHLTQQKALEGDKQAVWDIEFAEKALQEYLGVTCPKSMAWQERAVFYNASYRPMRVCGMVKNVGEPGGGPFWVRNADGTETLQIVESAQVDMSIEAQKEVFMQATHFNPVDLACSTVDLEGNKIDLLAFRDPTTGFITAKSKDGKDLKAQELPGLWNGSMARWETIFVEVPLETFNPVKIVNDLLRPQHQPNV